MKVWMASAPANIALIKYMGKGPDNIPLNTSFSYTLDRFRTTVTLELIEGKGDQWDNSVPMKETDQARFLRHLSYLKECYEISHSFLLKSENNFPSHCGLASSASSFAALTITAVRAFESLHGLSKPESLVRMSELSRRGSGSSCRSFFRPFAVWNRSGAMELDTKLPFSQLIHQVVVVDETPKEVSSSEAHKRSVTSPLWAGREDRAESRFVDLIEAMKHNNWKKSFQLVWDEFQDMHSLFETAKTPFRYRNQDTAEVLELTRELWEKTGDGPLVTMDAGPNVHILYRPDQRDICKKFYAEQLRSYRVLGDEVAD